MKKAIRVARVKGKCENAVAISDIRPLIHVIRGQQVMLDADLAALYGYSTKQFNRQVKNNAGKFDADFMFRLTDDEVANLRCKKCTSSWGGTRYLPHAFTEQGVSHDRYIVLDYGTGAEQIFHCGASSKDGGNRVMTIETVTERHLYKPLFDQLVVNPILVLK